MKEYTDVEIVEFDGDMWEPFLIMMEYLATKNVVPPKSFADRISEIANGS